MITGTRFADVKIEYQKYKMTLFESLIRVFSQGGRVTRSATMHANNHLKSHFNVRSHLDCGVKHLRDDWNNLV